MLFWKRAVGADQSEDRELYAKVIGWSDCRVIVKRGARAHTPIWKHTWRTAVSVQFQQQQRKTKKS